MKYKEQILFLFTTGILYYVCRYNNYSSLSDNIKYGIIGVAFFIIMEGFLRSDTKIFNSFNGFWKCVYRFCMIYACFLVFLIFQNEKDARQLFKNIYSFLGKPVPHSMHTYDDNCEIELKNIVDNLDHYYQIHLINWFAATLIVRDRSILHFWSILDEIIELSVQHILPHFRECWWDHIFIDILLSNTVAIEFGLFVIKLIKMKKYDWLGKENKTSLAQWDLFNNHKRFGALVYIFFIIIINFLTGFFMINSLWIPPKNNINLYRLLVWFLLSNLAFRETYNDIETWGTLKRLETCVTGKARWLILFFCFGECFVSIKFLKDAGNLIDNFVTPIYIWVPWLAVGVTSILFYLYLRFQTDSKNKYPKELYEFKNKQNLLSITSAKKKFLELKKDK